MLPSTRRRRLRRTAMLLHIIRGGVALGDVGGITVGGGDSGYLPCHVHWDRPGHAQRRCPLRALHLTYGRRRRRPGAPGLPVLASSPWPRPDGACLPGTAI